MKSYLVNIVICLIASVTLLVNPPNNILAWDTYGHYLYLPATFIYDDPFIQDIEVYDKLNEKYENLSSFYVAYRLDNGNHLIKYPVGFSVLMSPFFTVGHWLCGYTDYPQDGFSKPYQYSIIIGCWFYFILGMVFLERTLSYFFSNSIVILTILIFLFGTNAFFYGIYLPGMIHGVSFGLFAMLLYFTIKWYESPTLLRTIMLSLSFGLLCLSRASDVIAILIPIFWGIRVFSRTGIKERFNFFRRNLGRVILVGFVVFFCALLQLVYWKSCSGNWFLDPYQNPGEGFDFFPPHTIDYLFSYRKGLLLYTPIMLFALIGLFWVYLKKKSYEVLFVFGILNILFLSSWTCWWYGGSFGQRSIVQSYPVYVIGIGFFLKEISLVNWKKYVFGSLTFVLLVFNCFQLWQFTQGILHSSKMTKEAYWAIFLKTEKPSDYDKLLIVDDALDPELCISDTENFYLYGERMIDFEKEFEDMAILNSRGETRCFQLNDTMIFTPVVSIPFNELSNEQYCIFRVSASFKIIGDPKKVKASLVYVISHHEMYFQKYLVPSELVGDIERGWNRFSMSFFAPYVRSTDDKVDLFGWLMGEGEAYIDDIKIETYLKK
ncbi:MAG: hypothetical protein H6600_00245 [Flavobacteriales bacterium]|nr:hypothetical protein [Flavobacteriales bacterium]MCB9196863.1 hypothetical protein [Flavobacteriales bacterium]